MRKRTPEELASMNEKLENFCAFVKEILEDPSILDDIPTDSNIELTPIEDAAPDGPYVARNRRFAVSVKRVRPEPITEPGQQSA